MGLLHFLFVFVHHFVYQSNNQFIGAGTCSVAPNSIFPTQRCLLAEELFYTITLKEKLPFQNLNLNKLLELLAVVFDQTIQLFLTNYYFLFIFE